MLRSSSGWIAVFSLILLSCFGCGHGARVQNHNVSTKVYSTVLQGADESPIIFVHHVDQRDLQDFSPLGEMYQGIWEPSIDQILQADRLILDATKTAQPDRTYIRQYCAFRAGGKDYLWIQLTAKGFIDRADTSWSFEVAPMLKGLYQVWDGGPDFGDALYDAHKQSIVVLQFNGNV